MKLQQDVLFKNLMDALFLTSIAMFSYMLLHQALFSSVALNMQTGDGNEGRSISMKGKSACTKFTRISTNGTHSIVLCEPITGRTHQVFFNFYFFPLFGVRGC